jgi:hypothetical protein
VGVVWKVDVDAGNVTTTIEHDSMDSSPRRAGGINGLKYQNEHLFYMSTGANANYRVPIFPDATASAEPELSANITKGDD